MRDAEGYLSNISQKCNTRLLEKARFNTLRISKQSRSRISKNYAHGSHLALLQQCPGIIISILKSGQPLKLAAQILVLSRHLHKKASEDISTAPFVNTLRLRLGKIRMKLLSIIDKSLASPTLEPTSTIDAMSAYSLATNSSCTDNLRHFHHVRLGAISMSLQEEGSDNDKAIYGLNLWIKTMQETQTLFPRQVSGALAELKKIPLLQNERILDIHELDLDNLGVFIDDEFKHFTPYIRHDDLNVSTAAKLLASWSPVALEAYIKSLRTILDTVDDFQRLLDLRKECLQMWILSKGCTVGVTKSESLDILRKAFQLRLSRIIDNQAKDIVTVVETIQTALSTSDFFAEVQQSLWSSELVHIELSNGASKLMNGVHTRVHGSSLKNEHVLEVYKVWANRINMTRASILELKSKKWTIEELDDEEEDIDDIEDMKYWIEKEDPIELETKLQSALATSIEFLQTGIGACCLRFADDANAGNKAIFVIRLLREIKRTPPNGVVSQDMAFLFVAGLHRAIARPIVQSLISDHKSSILTSIRKVKITARLLWDGVPCSPIVPSPWSFRLLKSLQQKMTVIGTDVWTKHAIREIQEILRSMLLDLLLLTSNLDDDEVDYMTLEASEVNGSEHSNQKSERNEAKTQLLFDILYLRAALSTHDIEEESLLQEYCDTIIQDVKLSTELFDRVEAAALEYWKRTSLLFNLLA